MLPSRRGFDFYLRLLKESAARFMDEDAPTHAAALAYSMVFSLPPMMLVILWIAGRLYREVVVREALFSEIGGLVGADGARQLTVTVEMLEIREPGGWAAALAIGALLFTATTVLVTMQNALNRIFGAEAPDKSSSAIWKMLRDRILSLGMLITLAFILTVSFAVDALIASFGAHLVDWIGELAAVVVAFDSLLIDLLAISLLYAMLFRLLPDVTLEWRDIAFGALLTASLFVAGKNLIASVIGQSGAADLYGAAGSILVLMLWVYYASALLLFGAVLTYTRARLLGDERDEGKGRETA